jgi:aminocarboxymuconate-semialdehyde decarboxylase
MDRSIDVFCHCLPPAFSNAANSLLKKPLLMFERAQRMPVMVDTGARLRMMDEFPGYSQVLSLASPTIEAIAVPEQAPELARIGNDALCEMASGHRDRFPGWIASLPMNNPDAAITEMDRTVKQLGAAGVQIYTNVKGSPLDEPRYLQIIEYAAKIGCPIWLHPIRAMSSADYSVEDVSRFDLWWALGWPYETSLAMARLVFSGLFDRWPDLTVLTHHCGGMIPMMEGRIESGLQLLGTRNPPQHADAVRTELMEPPVDAFRRFHADTASFGSKAAIECALAFFGIDRILFATDSPFDPDAGPGYIRSTLQAIEQMDLEETDRQAILNGNAARLFNLEAFDA